MVQLQGLRRVSAKEGQMVSIPERVALHLGMLHSAENELKDQLGRDPSDIELADHTKLSTKRIAYIRQAKPTYAEGQFMSQSEEGGEELIHPATAGLNDEHWVKYVHSDLSPTDQVILEHSLGLFGKRKLNKGAIARKLNMSGGAVTQRAAKIQSMLDKGSQLGAGLI
jgi:DNA-directed RNA polymerase specialized sigma subunit